MAWNLVPKPSESSVATSVLVQNVAAQPFGILMAITSVVASGAPSASVVGSSITSGWGEVAKPTSSVWTFVSKPIS